MEILNSKARGPGPGQAMAAVIILAGLVMAFAGEGSNAIFARRAQAAFQHAQQHYQSNTNDAVAAWQFARACFGLNSFVTNLAGRADLAGQGIAACRQSLALESNSAPGHYYLAIELGQLADTKRNLTAFKMVREIEREFKTADDQDEHFDYAGSARCLGLLYRDAPGWPMSIGSRRKARDWLEQAVKLAPDYPENHLALIESYWQWKDREAASNAWQQLNVLWPVARTNFTGETWERNWRDWTTRHDALQDKFSGQSTSGKSSNNSRN